MAETIDELTIAYSDQSGKELVRELDKKILTRGAWSTIVYLYQERKANEEEWGPQKARIERYQKRNGRFRSQSRFKISNGKQARQVVEALDAWFPAEEK